MFKIQNLILLNLSPRKFCLGQSVATVEIVDTAEIESGRDAKICFAHSAVVRINVVAAQDSYIGYVENLLFIQVSLFFLL